MPKVGFWSIWILVILCFVNQASSIDSGDVSLPALRLKKNLQLRREEATGDEQASTLTNWQHSQVKAKGRYIRSATNSSSSDVTNNTRVINHMTPSVPMTILPPTSRPLEINCGSKVYSCSNKCKNKTEHSVFSSKIQPSAGSDCYCDKACNDVFNDCCSDYKQSCSMNSKLKADFDDFYRLDDKWRCETMNVNTGGCSKPRGLWVVAQCPDLWPNGEVKTKCHNPAVALQAHTFLSYLPVVALPSLLTYRNRYCAICNNVSTYKFWTLIFKAGAIPPPNYTPNDLATFIEKYSQFEDGIRPEEGQRIRWCTYPEVISTCPNTTSEHHMKNCEQGTAGLVEEIWSRKIFKNRDCALCNGYRLTCGVSVTSVSPCNIDGSSISRAISLRDYGISMTTKSCRKNEVYDTFLKKCRQTYVINTLHSGYADEYQVTMSVLIKTNAVYFIDTFILERSLSEYFKVNKSKINDVEIIRNNVVGNLELFFKFNIQLTQAQSLILATDVKLNGSSNETTTLRRLFKFSEVFQLPVGFQKFTIYRQKIRQVNCTRPQVYQYGDYIFLHSLKIRVLSTGAIYEQFEYYRNSTEKNASVTVCLKFVSHQCNGSYIKLNSSEFSFTGNLTLVYNSLMFKLGDYIYNNGLVYICVDFEKEYTTSTGNTAPKDELALVILTWIGFILSIIGLLILILTYVIFKELRTLPGKNLMNLSISLCLAEIFWLVGSMLDNYPTTCTVVAIVIHYSFLAFFTASSVIAFHSCLVFGRKMTIRRSVSENNKIFVIYSLIVWGIPGLFLLIFGLLDRYGVFAIDYGKAVVCWLGTRQSKIYLFILPFGILLLFNLILFIVVAVRLRENQRSSAKALGKEAKKRESQNIKVCLKLSTLMGFSWLFGLLQVAVETETDAFAYLFIIFVSFQGLFICAAFLFQRKCYELYNTLMSSSSRGTSTGAETPSNARKLRIKDTKL
jgi:hypothetical protein